MAEFPPAPEAKSAAGDRSAGPGARGRAPAVVVARSRGELQAAEASRARRRALPAFVVAAIVHGAALWWLHTQVILPALREAEVTIDADFATPPDALEPEPTPEEVLVEPPPDPDADVEVLDEPPPSPSASSEVIGLGGGVGGRGSGTSPVEAAGIEGVRPSEFAGGLGATPFSRFVTDMRARGLDVAFVIDATGSMQRFIDRAQETVGRIMSDLSAVVPSVRLGLVAYRDLGDPWTVRVKDLSDDAWSVQTFLYGLEASGGKRVTPDFEEAVEVGLATAAETLSWRPGARRVIILVGDAPYHEEDRPAALATVRAFARDEHSLVNTLYVGAGDAQRATENQTRAREALELLARTGGGRAFELAADDPGADEALRAQVSEATFGRDFQADIEAFLARTPLDPLLASVRRHVARADRKWIARRLADERPHPAVVEGAVSLFDATIARACLAILQDEARPLVARSACLYVLVRSIESLEGLELDTHLPLAGQEEDLAAVRRGVEALQPRGAGAAPPALPPGPPPAPPPVRRDG